MQILSPKLRAQLKAEGYRSIALDSDGMLYAYVTPVTNIQVGDYEHSEICPLHRIRRDRLICTIDPITMEDIDWTKTLKAL